MDEAREIRENLDAAISLRGMMCRTLEEEQCWAELISILREEENEAVNIWLYLLPCRGDTWGD